MKKDEPMRNINPFGLRMQPALRERVEAAAAQNHRSLNAEIVARLEESFGVEGAGRSSSLENAIAMVDQLRDELLAIAASSKE